MCVELTPLSHCALDKKHRTVAIHENNIIDQERFNSDVKRYAAVFSPLNQNQFALYIEHSYIFCVYLYALLHSNKKVWIAGNNTPDTADKLISRGCQLLGDWHGQELTVELGDNEQIKLKPLDLRRSELLIFTSGSTGEPKAIIKNLRQLQTEIETLEKHWGGLIRQSQVLATVSHQHIYGLLFRLLWPLTAGRCFYSQMYLTPEALLNVRNNNTAYWVASPAQLKRLDELSPWSELAKLTAIFSSGGALDNRVAEQIDKKCGQKVIEVYGSSETGGIGWRQGADNTNWRLFDGVKLTMDEEGCCQLSSPYLAEQHRVVLDDKIEFEQDGRFRLLGRTDRIVKVEEKRISLDHLEQTLNDFRWVSQSYTLLLTNKRDIIAAVLILSDEGIEFLAKQGRAELIKLLRKELMSVFETVAIPRKWLFMTSLPLTVQGKIEQNLLSWMLTLQNDRFPQIHSCNLLNNQAKLIFKVHSGLEYFNGHFPGLPILPGVAQLAWVERYGKKFFNIEQPFVRLEVIKFKKVIRPNQLITMQIQWKPDTGKLYFDLTADDVSYSSGRMVYGAQ